MQTLRYTLAVLTIISGLKTNNLSPTSGSGVERGNLIELRSPEVNNGDKCGYFYDQAVQVYKEKIQGQYDELEQFDTVLEDTQFRRKYCDLSKIKWEWVFLTIKSSNAVCKLAIPFKLDNEELVFVESDFVKSFNHKNPNCMQLNPFELSEPRQRQRKKFPDEDDEENAIIDHGDHYHHGGKIYQKPIVSRVQNALSKEQRTEKRTGFGSAINVPPNLDYGNLMNQDGYYLKQKNNLIQNKSKPIRITDNLFIHDDHVHHGDHTHKLSDENLRAIIDREIKKNNNLGIRADNWDRSNNEIDGTHAYIDGKTYKLNDPKFIELIEQKTGVRPNVNVTNKSKLKGLSDPKFIEMLYEDDELRDVEEYDTLTYHGNHIKHGDHIHKVKRNEEGKVMIKNAAFSDLTHGDELVWQKNRINHKDHSHLHSNSGKPKNKLLLDKDPCAQELNESIKIKKDNRPNKLTKSPTIYDANVSPKSEKEKFKAQERANMEQAAFRSRKNYNDAKRHITRIQIDKSDCLPKNSLANQLTQNTQGDGFSINAHTVNIYSLNSGHEGDIVKNISIDGKLLKDR